MGLNKYHTAQLLLEILDVHLLSEAMISFHHKGRLPQHSHRCLFCSTSIERTQGIRPEVDAAIQQSVGRCIQESNLDIGERTVVRLSHNHHACNPWRSQSCFCRML